MKKTILITILMSILIACSNDYEKLKEFGAKGDKKYSEGKFEEAIILYSEALDFTDNNYFRALLYIKMGQVLNDSGDYKNSILSFNNSIKIDSNISYAYESRAYAKEQLGMFESAVNDYTKAIFLTKLTADSISRLGWSTLDTSTAVLFNNRGSLFRKVKKYNEALKDFNQAISIDSSLAESYSNVADLYSDMGNREEALKNLNIAIRQKPNIDYFYFNRGVNKFYLDDKKGALQDFDKAILLNTKKSNYYLNRAFAKHSLKDLNGACQDWYKAGQMGNKEAVEYYNKGCKQVKVTEI